MNVSALNTALDCFYMISTNKGFCLLIKFCFSKVKLYGKTANSNSKIYYRLLSFVIMFASTDKRQYNSKTTLTHL